MSVVNMKLEEISVYLIESSFKVIPGHQRLFLHQLIFQLLFSNLITFPTFSIIESRFRRSETASLLAKQALKDSCDNYDRESKSLA